MRLFLNILILIILLIQSTVLVAQQNDSISTYNSWRELLPSTLSPDQSGVLVKQYNQNNSKENTLFYVNLKTKKTINVQHLSNVYKHLLYNNLMVGNDKKNLAIINVINETNSLYLPNIKKFETKAIKNRNLVITLTQSNTLEIIQFNKAGAKDKTLLTEANINDFIVSPNKELLIYNYINDKDTVIIYDLINHTKESIIYPNISFSDLIWNQDQRIFAFKDKNNVINIVDTEKLQVKKIQLDQGNLKRFELNFYSNNDLFIKYNLDTEKEIPESEYVDIWKGNSKHLSVSTFNLKYEQYYKAYVYTYSQDKLITLKRKKDHDYIFINIPNYLVSSNPYKYKTYNSIRPEILFTISSLETNQEVYSNLLTNQRYIIPSKDGKYIIYPKEINSGKWEVYNLETHIKTQINIDVENEPIPTWSLDSEHIFYSKEKNLWTYNLKTHKENKVSNFLANNHFKYINIVTLKNFTNNFIDSKVPLLFTLVESTNTKIYSYFEGKTILRKEFYDSTITPASRLTNLTSQDTSTIVYTQENLLMPTTLKILHNKKETTLLTVDIPKELYDWQKIETISFQDKHNIPLKAILSYPKDFDPSKKYPMIVYIYDKVSSAAVYSNRVFKKPEKLNSIGFDSFTLNENGYFICYIDTYVSNEGPGLSAVECVTKGIEAVTKHQNAIDKDKLGLIGHSFGGYKASFIASHTNIFSAIVSGAGAHDLIGGFMYRYSNLRFNPEWSITENGQYSFKENYAENPQKYLDNSPILFAQNVKTPLLMWTGLVDENVYWENTRKMFVALKRYEAPTIALFYKDMEHGGGYDQPKQTLDLVQRTTQWFDYFLKDKKSIKWIKEGLDYNNYTID